MISYRSLLLSTIVLNDIYIYIYIYISLGALVPKATNYKLLVYRPGETMESMRVGGYYYYYLEYYYCTIQH